MKLGPYHTYDEAMATYEEVKSQNPRARPRLEKQHDGWVVVTDEPTHLNFDADPGNMLGRDR